MIRNEDWASEATLCRVMERCFSKSARVRNNLGHQYLAQGHPDLALQELLAA